MMMLRTFNKRSTFRLSQGSHRLKGFLSEPKNSLCINSSCRLDDNRRYLSFSFAGPRKLDEIVKVEKLAGKSRSEIAEIWSAYHESKEHIHGIALSGEEGKSILARAALCPFFVQPIFRDDGYFMLVSQFQKPYHFLMAYLEDYKMDPSAAQPLLTYTIFDNLIAEHNLALVRCDVINKGIDDDEALKVLRMMLDAYRNDDEFTRVHSFNKTPDAFDFDDHIAVQNQKWSLPPVAEIIENNSTTASDSKQ